MTPSSGHIHRARERHSLTQRFHALCETGKLLPLLRLQTRLESLQNDDVKKNSEAH